MRTGRLCSSLDDRIDNIQKEVSNIKENIQDCKGRKRNAEEARRDVDVRIQSVKVMTFRLSSCDNFFVI